MHIFGCWHTPSLQYLVTVQLIYIYTMINLTAQCLNQYTILVGLILNPIINIGTSLPGKPLLLIRLSRLLLASVWRLMSVVMHSPIIPSVPQDLFVH